MSTVVAFLWAAAAGLAVSVLDYAAMAALPRRRRRFDLTDPAFWANGLDILEGLVAEAEMLAAAAGH